MIFKDRVAELNEHFFLLYQSRSFQEKKTCSNSPLSRLTHNDLRFLELLERKGTRTMRELSDTLALPMSTLTGIADKLIKKKYIERIRSEEDRRVVKVSPTPLGVQMIALRKSAHTEVSEKILQALTEAEQDDFLRLFKKAIG